MRHVNGQYGYTVDWDLSSCADAIHHLNPLDMSAEAIAEEGRSATRRGVPRVHANAVRWEDGIVLDPACQRN